MGDTLIRNVQVTDDRGRRITISAGTERDDIPADQAAQITNPKAWGEPGDLASARPPAAGLARTADVMIHRDPDADEADVQAAPEAVTQAADVEDLSDLTVKQLRERADAAGLDVPSRARKSEIIEALENA